MQKSRVHLDDPPKGVCFDHLPDPLHGGKEREFRRASYKNAGVFGDAGENRVVGRPVDAERLLAHQVLSGGNGCAVNLPVQIVRQCTVHRLDLGIAQ